MESHIQSNNNKENENPAPLSERAEKSASDIKVYPSDFLHGLLSAHVSEETGFAAGKCPLMENSKISFKTENRLYKEFLTNKNININNLLNNWFIEKIIDNEETGYCGIVYKNILTQNIVLAHRSTNFKLGFGSNLFKQSGVQADYESVLLGILVPHMAFGHQATKIAVEIARKLNYTLSITGHSLGAFISEMSIYYCCYELDFKYVKAIVFDGPGSWDLMNLLNTNMIKNSVNMIKLEELDIVSYVTAPNLVNCCNSRLGKVFTIFPKLEKDLGDYSKIIKIFGKKYDSALCTTAFGHDLINILPYFDIVTGRPFECELVIRWPKISHKDYGNKRDSNSITTSIISKMFSSSSVDMILGFFNFFIREEKVLNTVESIVFILQDFLLGKINLEQFWNVHTIVNVENDFHKPKDLQPKEEFNLIYSQNYLTKKYNIYEYTLNDKNDDIDRFLMLLKLKEEYIKEFMTSIEMLVPFWDYYYYQEGLNEIKIDEKFRNEISVHDLRDYMRFLLLKKAFLLNKLTSINRESLASTKIDKEIKINSLKNNYKILIEIIKKEKLRYEDDEDYLTLLNTELEKIEKFLLKNLDELLYKNHIILFGRTNAGKSTLGTKFLLNDEKMKIFPTSAIAETFVPCMISVKEELKKADVHINYKAQEAEKYEADSLDGLLVIINNNICKKSYLNKNNKAIQGAIINSPRTFFPTVKSDTTITDTPGFSENEQMKELNISQLTKEKNRSVIVFLIPLEVGGSLMQENVDILSAYKSEETDLSSNIIFVLTKLKNFKNCCETDNEDYSDEELLNHINKLIQEGFVLPLKNKYPSARIIIYEIGRDMDKFYYDKETLFIKMGSESQKSQSDINIKQETVKFLNDYVIEQFLNNESLYMNHLKENSIKSVNRVKQFIFEFHSQDKNVKENKKKISRDLNIFIKNMMEKKISEYKTDIFNKNILTNLIDKNINEDNYKSREKCLSTVEAEVHCIIENFLTCIGYSLEEVFYEHLFFHVLRELPSDRNSVKSKVIKIREEIVQFLKKEKEHCTKLNTFQIMVRFFKRVANYFKSELSNFKSQIYDTYSTEYWIDGREITQFFNHLLKKMPVFINLLGVQYQNKTYSGKSNDLYKQSEHLVELINKSY